MIIYFMKQDALDYLKSNMNELYTHYYSDETNEWINENYGQDAFSVFKEIPDLELASLDGSSAGEIDFSNISKVYLALKDLSESQAADERLWAGLCNGVFYQYLRKRWKYDEKDIVDAKNDASTVLSRFFFSSGVRSSYYRNSLSKYWWVGKLLYDEHNDQNPFYPLEVLGGSDINSKITEIFYNYTFSSNPQILKGFISALEHFYKKNVYLPVREVFRPTLQYINAVGGVTLLDAFTTEEIRDMTIEKINGLLTGKGSALTVYDEEEDEIENEERQVEIEKTKIQPLSEPEPDPVVESSEDIFVKKGDTVTILLNGKKRVWNIPQDIENDSRKLFLKKLLGKKIGFSYKAFGNTIEITKIE